jgi:hypothetical protein
VPQDEWRIAQFKAYQRQAPGMNCRSQGVHGSIRIIVIIKFLLDLSANLPLDALFGFVTQGARRESPLPVLESNIEHRGSREESCDEPKRRQNEEQPPKRTG